MEEVRITLKCAWCGLIHYGGQWRPERRQGPVIYSHGICLACRQRHFPGRPRHRPAGPAPARPEDGTAWAVLALAASLAFLAVAAWRRRRASGRAR